jgi:hypothetical protein
MSNTQKLSRSSPAVPISGQLSNREISLQTVSSLALASLLLGCSSLKRNPIAHVTPDQQHGYVLQIDFSYRSYCVCEFPPRTHKQIGSDWIFVDTTNGVVAADHLTLWHGNSPRDDFGWAQKVLLGSVAFTNDCMRVAFEVPDYRDDGSIRRHEAYSCNGNYRLE